MLVIKCTTHIYSDAVTTRYIRELRLILTGECQSIFLKTKNVQNIPVPTKPQNLNPYASKLEYHIKQLTKKQKENIISDKSLALLSKIIPIGNYKYSDIELNIQSK